MIQVGRNACIIAEERVHPGVRVVVDGIHVKVEDEFSEIIFIRKTDKVLSRRYVPEMYEKLEIKN